MLLFRWFLLSSALLSAMLGLYFSAEVYGLLLFQSCVLSLLLLYWTVPGFVEEDEALEDLHPIAACLREVEQHEELLYTIGGEIEAGIKEGLNVYQKVGKSASGLENKSTDEINLRAITDMGALQQVDDINQQMLLIVKYARQRLALYSANNLNTLSPQDAALFGKLRADIGRWQEVMYGSERNARIGQSISVDQLREFIDGLYVEEPDYRSWGVRID